LKQKDYSCIVDIPQLPDNAISSIIADSGVQLSKELQKELEYASKDYIVDIELLDKRPRSSQNKKLLKKVAKLSNKLSKLLNDLDDATAGMINLCLAREYKTSYYDVKRYTSLLEISCKSLCNKIPNDDGRRKKLIAIRRYIKRIIPIYLQATNQTELPAWNNPYSDKNPVRGGFFEFVDACLWGIGYPPDKQKSLRKIIQEVREDFQENTP
jgi:hypothetical protein